MSWYMSVRIKCIIKEEFRKGFEPIALHGLWDRSGHPVLRDFGLDEDASAIPTNHCSFPAKWAAMKKVGNMKQAGMNNRENGYLPAL